LKQVGAANFGTQCRTDHSANYMQWNVASIAVQSFLQITLLQITGNTDILPNGQAVAVLLLR